MLRKNRPSQACTIAKITKTITNAHFKAYIILYWQIVIFGKLNDISGKPNDISGKLNDISDKPNDISGKLNDDISGCEYLNITRLS